MKTADMRPEALRFAFVPQYLFNFSRLKPTAKEMAAE
jgi:hypothetical protein